MIGQTKEPGERLEGPLNFKPIAFKVCSVRLIYKGFLKSFDKSEIKEISQLSDYSLFFYCRLSVSATTTCISQLQKKWEEIIRIKIKHAFK